MKKFTLENEKPLEDTKIAGGRPKKKESEKANKKVVLYFTETQLENLEKIALADNRSVKDYIKSRL